MLIYKMNVYFKPGTVSDYIEVIGEIHTLTKYVSLILSSTVLFLISSHFMFRFYHVNMILLHVSILILK